MANPFFQFKQFTVWHDRCAMKVGTDGTLLGAWVPVQGANRVLDVGTGSGLISLMIAQRQPLARIDAIDLDEAAVLQAEENVKASPFSDRIQVLRADFLQFSSEPYDLIVCNPPFFQNSLHCPEKQRTMARHNETLPFDQLCSKVADLLNPNGRFCVVLPADCTSAFISDATMACLHLSQVVEVCTKEGKPVKRVLLSFCRNREEELQKTTLYMMDAQGSYTDDYRVLTGDFYLK